MSTDPLAASFAPWSPYNYVLDNPIKYTDPDGRHPIIGAVVGFLLDYGIQVGSNLTQGKTWGESLTDIDGTSLTVSTVSGAAGVGLVQKAGTLFKGRRAIQAAEIGIDAGINMTAQGVQKGEIDLRETALAVIGGQAVRSPLRESVTDGAEETARGLQKELSTSEDLLQTVANKNRPGLSPEKAAARTAPYEQRVAQDKINISGHARSTRVTATATGASSSGAVQRMMNNLIPGQGPVYILQNPYENNGG